MDLLEKGAKLLTDVRHKHMTHIVRFSRGTDAVELSASVGSTTFEQADDFGLIQRTETRDFIVRTTDLAFGGSPVLPKEGDQIRETQGTVTYVYEVLSPGTEPLFRFVDSYRKSLRIHTKHVGTEP